MIAIKELVEAIEDEIDYANRKMNFAFKYKDFDPNRADFEYGLSVDAVGRINALHNKVVEKIAEYRKESGEPPAAMQTLYDWEHQKAIKRVKELKTLQQMYREG